MFAKKDIESALNIQVATSPEMLQAQELWRKVYKGEANWNNEKIPSLKLAKGICEKVSKLATVEFESEVSGSVRAEYLDKQYQRVVKVHGNKGFRATVEKGCAGGTMILRPFVRGDEIYVTVVENNCYYPIAYNERDELVSAIFADTIVEDETYFTLLEYCTFEDNEYTIKYTAYQSDDPKTLGKPIPLEKVEKWANLPPDITFFDVENPWFAVFTMPQVGTEEDSAPEGSAVFASAINGLRKADRQEELTEHEFDAGRLKQNISADMLKKNAKGEYITPDGDVFAVFETAGDKEYINTYNPAFRLDALRARLNDIKRDIEFNCGLSYGTISDVSIQAKTATEVEHGRADTASTVTSIQTAWEETLKCLVAIMDEMATQYYLAPSGDYDVSFFWDDSVIITTEEKLALYNSELSSLLTLKGAGVVGAAEVRAFVEQNSEYFSKLTEDMIAEAGERLPEVMTEED